MNVIETHDLGRRYGATWALRECSLAIPAGSLTALVGPNGAGKTTLLNLVMGLSTPSSGELTVLGELRPGSLPALDGIGFVAQDVPVYRGFSVADMVSLTKNLNRTFDTAYARQRLADLGIDPRKRAGQLSGGQRAQLALTLALARHPVLLVLDEPTAALDPLARHDFMATVMAAMADDGVSVVLSSHLLTELERVADHLVLLSGGRVRLDGPVDDLLAVHRLVYHPLRAGLDRTRMGGRRAERRRRPDPAARPAPLARGRAACRAVTPGRSGSRSSRWPTYAPARAVRGRRPRRSPPMTALAPASHTSTAIGPVPLRQLAWVAWRRNRATVLGLGGFLAVLAAYLVVTGLQAHAAYDDLGSCVPPITTDACRLRGTVPEQPRPARLAGPAPGAAARHRRRRRGCAADRPRARVRRVPLLLDPGSRPDAVGRRVILPIAILTAALMGALGLLVWWRNAAVTAAGASQRLDSSSSRRPASR